MKFATPLNDAEIAEIAHQKIADQALAEFKAKHKDFDALFPVGIVFNFNGVGEITKRDVYDALCRKYRYEKNRKAFHDEIGAQNNAIRVAIEMGCRPPKADAPRVNRRVKIDKQPDGSVIVDELDVDH